MKRKRNLKKEIRILGKLLLTVLILLLFIRLIAADQRQRQGKQPEGELVKREEVEILMKELLQCGIVPVRAELFGQELEKTAYESADEENLTYRSFCLLLEGLLGEEGKRGERAQKLYREITYSGKYGDDHRLLKADWYESYQKLLQYFRLTDRIRKLSIEILCGSDRIVGKTKIPQGAFLTKTGAVYVSVSEKEGIPELTKATAYLHGDRLLVLTEKLQDTVTLENIWIMETPERQIHFFWNGYEINATWEQVPEQWTSYREQIVDLSFAGGRILRADKKGDRISGKLLAVTDTQAEVEGYGSFLFDEQCSGYQLYGEMRCVGKRELIIGYDFADLVIDKGKICAFLIARSGQPETIRVAIKSSGFASLYHDKIELEGQDGLTVSYGAYGRRKEEEVLAGNRLVIPSGHEWLEEGRIEVRSKTNTGKIKVTSLTRNQGVPSYRGSFEIIKTTEGLVLINEVPLEEYLYSVVPSEMPASYPAEALKAQAVCARTYGYRYILEPGYAWMGAHVDDSVSYQVYNNVAENVNATGAVRETTGILLWYDDAPINAYYYSTSCGFGTDAGIWEGEQAGALPYLRSRHIAEGQTEGEAESEGLMQEEIFENYITGGDAQAYEKEEPWFRWSYEVKEMNVGLLEERLREQNMIGKEKIKKIYDIRCTKRRRGGVMEELEIETDTGTFTVDSEYKIRYVLNQGGKVIRQDGSGYESPALLPSAYMIIDVVKSQGNVVGYKIVGGGFGHGVGMSQNGAKAMALRNISYEEILSFYYRGCRMQMLKV